MIRQYLEKDLKHISIKNLDLDFISNEIKEKGFFVCEGLINLDLINPISEYWKKIFLILNNKKPSIKMVRGNLHLGEKDFDSYTKNKKWHIYRIFKFYWNKPVSIEDRITRDIAVDLHRIKNVLMGNHPSYALEYQSNGDGTYLSISHYPPNDGFMKFHPDNLDSGSIYQFMVNLTYKNIDYKDGGLKIIVKGELIDLDSYMKPGSVLFYDGGYEHGVEPVSSDTSLGRIAFFSIPASFFSNKDVPNFMRFIEKIYFKLSKTLNK